MSRRRLAPTASLIAISLRRASARANMTLATFAHATTRSSPTAASAIASDRRCGIVRTSRFFYQQRSAHWYQLRSALAGPRRARARATLTNAASLSVSPASTRRPARVMR